ncbi:MAG: methyltransferase domain-containing protein [Ignavibacteria bacterium]|jgi:ubiquinone/menaquinone biosynthesis C-methylase UbiE
MEERAYIFGTNKAELERLRFQHIVWRQVTENLFDRIKVKEGWKCLDVGAGPGFVAIDIRNRIGNYGEVTALEPSDLFLNHFKSEVSKMGWTNVKFVNGTVSQAFLPENYYDFIFVRWVISVVPFPQIFLNRLAASLAPGGILAIQDYAYEGLALYPRGGAFEKMADAVKKYYRSQGGDPYIATKLPELFKSASLEMIDFKPNCLAGKNDSGIYEWGHRFFTLHIHRMVEKGIIMQKLADDMLADWQEHKRNPNSIFFSPIVVDVVGQKRKVSDRKSA